MLSQSEENYLKAIYSLSYTEDKISTNLLAEKMNTKASSVTDMVKKLSEKSYITYLKYKGFELTEKGSKLAAQIVRKHRLWEVFLVDKLKFGWEEVHDIAEQLEHIQSKQLTDKLDDFLGNPKFDPHGDPIPDKNGVYPSLKVSFPLNAIELNTIYTITGVEDGSMDFFQFLKRYEIGLGSEIKVLEKFPFDDSLRIQIDQSEMNISAIVSKKIFVQKVIE